MDVYKLMEHGTYQSAAAPAPVFVVVKLGGAAITVKAELQRFDDAVLPRTADPLAAFYSYYHRLLPLHATVPRSTIITF